MSCVTTLQQLIACESLTPHDAGCMPYIESLLAPLGFTFFYVDANSTRNMYAQVGEGDFNFCFAGHTDVVPVGDAAAWQFPPFSGTIHNNAVYGRGTCDMKGAIAAFITALQEIKTFPKNKKISILLTSDEEGDATFGIPYALPILKEKGFIPSLCLVGEPTTVNNKPYIKIGRRGSFNARIIIKGQMGHVAYPESAKNPHVPLLLMMKKLMQHSFDQGTDSFAPTNLEVTNVNAFNQATNIIPEKVELRFNIRFNPLHTKQTLEQLINNFIDQAKVEAPGFDWQLALSCDSNADLCEDPHLIQSIQKATCDVLHEQATCTTFGATSDARFIQQYCPVVEFGLATHQAHQINEHVLIQDLENLKNIYKEILQII